MSKRHAALLSIGALVALALPAGPAEANHVGNFTCRASVVRVTTAPGLPVVGGTVVEPIVANDQNNPCANEVRGIRNARILGQTPLTILPDQPPFNGRTFTTGAAGVNVSLRTLFAETGTEEHNFGRAESGVVVLVVELPAPVPESARRIEVRILTAEAAAVCDPTTAQPAFTSGSQVLGLKIGNQQVVNTSAPQTIPLPLGVGTIYLNRTIDEQIPADAAGPAGAKRTQRALEIDVPALANIVVAEAVADYRGNPCSPAEEERFPGWMNGGGWVAEPGSKHDRNGEGQINPGTKMQHAFNIDCFVEPEIDPGPGKDNLVAQWFDEPGKEHSSVKMTELIDAACTDSDDIDSSGQPRSQFDTLTGQGLGVCRSSEGEVPVLIDFRFTDAGEPGSQDYASITTGLAPLVDPDTVPDEAEALCLFDIGDGFLDGGNHQAHQTPAQFAGSTSKGGKP